MSAKRKVSCKPLFHKYEALKKLENGVAKKDVAFHYNIPRNTLSTWIKNKEKILKAFEGGYNHNQQRLRTSDHGTLDKALYKWFVKAREEGVPISGSILKQKGVKYAEELGIDNFKASNGWFDRWKNRHGIVLKTVSGEAKSCTTHITESWEGTTLSSLLSNYALRDIYNADEFGLFYKALPGRHSEARLTVLAAANAEGEKLPIFVIGNSAKPRCFTGVINLPCRYRAQENSWMDGRLFEEWVREQDQQFEHAGRKIALIVDHCPAHPNISNLKAINLIFLPPNSTSKTQPMNQGIVKSTKAFYRAACVRKLLDAIENHKPPPSFSILDAMSILTNAWSRVSGVTVQRCFAKAGIAYKAQQIGLNDDEDPFKILLEEINALRERIPKLAPEEVSTEDVVNTDDDVLTSDIDFLSDNAILAEFREETMDKDAEDEEECPKRPTESEVRQAIDTLSCYSLFANEAADEIRHQTNQLSFLIEKSIRKSQQKQTIENFFTLPEPSNGPTTDVVTVDVPSDYICVDTENGHFL